MKCSTLLDCSIIVPSILIALTNRYQLMLLCWSSEPESRLNFTQLKFFFKSIITAANKETNYITIQP